MALAESHLDGDEHVDTKQQDGLVQWVRVDMHPTVWLRGDWKSRWSDPNSDTPTGLPADGRRC